MNGTKAKPAQSEKFAELARSLECDEDEARWEEKLKAVATRRIKDQKDK